MTQWIGSPHIQSKGVVDGDGFPCPRFGSMENLEEPLAAREWTWAGAQGVQLLYLVFVFVLKIWNRRTPNKPMLDLVFVNSGHIHLSAPNKSNMIKQPNSKWIPYCLIRGMDCFFLCWWRNPQEAETKVGPMNPQYLGPAILPLERLAKDHPPGDRRNPIPSMFLPCSWFFHRDCHSFALDMDLLRQIDQHKLCCIMIACLVDPKNMDPKWTPNHGILRPNRGCLQGPTDLIPYHGHHGLVQNEKISHCITALIVFFSFFNGSSKNMFCWSGSSMKEMNLTHGKPISGCGDRDLFTRDFSDAQTENNLGN